MAMKYKIIRNSIPSYPPQRRDRHESLKREVALARPEVLFVGDSLTDQWRQAGLVPWQQFFGPMGAADIGIGGDRAADLLWRIKDGAIDGIAPRVIFLCIGANDLPARDPEGAAVTVVNLCQEIMLRQPKARLLLSSVLPYGREADAELRPAARRLNRLLEALALDLRIGYLDSWTPFLTSQGEFPAELSQDAIHLTEAGYSVWAPLIHAAIIPLLAEVPSSETPMAATALPKFEVVRRSRMVFEHFPHDSERLVIFYGPARFPPPALPHYKSSAQLAAGRLLINAGTNNFWLDCLDELERLVERVSANYGQTIHTGVSMGANGAIRFGAADPKAAAIFAMAPHFVLNRPYSLSHELIDPALMPKDEKENSLIWRINSIDKGETHIFISCTNTKDGVQVRDAQEIKSGNVNVHFLMEPHGFPSFNRPDVVADYLAHGRMLMPSRVRLASAFERQVAIEAYELIAEAGAGGPFTDRPALQSDDAPFYAEARGRWLAAQGKNMVAFPWFAQAASGHAGHVGEAVQALTCAGHVMKAAGWHDLAIGLYRQAIAFDPKFGGAWIALADLEVRRGADGKYFSVLGECALSGVNADAFAKVKAMAPKRTAPSR